MEARGEIRGGRFVAGFLGEQFAQPEAVDLLRAFRRQSNGGATTRNFDSGPAEFDGNSLARPARQSSRRRQSRSSVALKQRRGFHGTGEADPVHT